MQFTDTDKPLPPAPPTALVGEFPPPPPAPPPPAPPLSLKVPAALLSGTLVASGLLQITEIASYQFSPKIIDYCLLILGASVGCRFADKSLNEDVKNAFQYYLKHYNKGKPIIIASHSQGSMHAKRLIKEFFDQKPLKNQLVVAYLIGTRIFPNEFESIPPLESPNDVGGFVSWNAYKMDKFPKKYKKWYQGGVTTNPISWDTKDFKSK